MDYCEHSNPLPGRKPYTRYEITYCLKDILGYSWTKANTRPIQYLRPGIQEDKVVFKEFIKLLEKMDFTICYVDECSINATGLPIYTWSKKGQEQEKLIRGATDRYNAIAALVDDRCMFRIKKGRSNAETFKEFLTNMKKELEVILGVNQLKYRTVIVFDNARIHKTPLIMNHTAELGFVCVTTPPYCPEVNKIEHLFGNLKKKLCQENLVNKDYLYVIKRCVTQLRREL